MRVRDGLAIDYMRPRERSWWMWSESGEVVCWIDGQTIAFRDELVELLERLAPAGLVRFDVLLAALALAREGWRASEIPARLAKKLPEELRELADRVEGLPPDLRGGTDAKTVLLRYLLQGLTPRHAAEEAREIVIQARDGLPLEALRPMPIYYPDVPLLSDDIESLRPGLERLDEQSLRRFARTGLEELPDAAPLELPDALLARRLLSELEGDPKHKGLSRIARDLMAALRLPRPVFAHEELSFGGIADISHRGPLERLLISELAQDDLTLTARLASGEALFLERETPPAHPAACRALLVDCGLRMWGLARVYAAACALGLAATADPRGEVHAYRAQGRRALSIGLATRDGFEHLLGAQETDEHPGAALADFVRLAGGAQRDGTSLELLVLTSERALQDEAFLVNLKELSAETLLILSLHPSGRLRLIAISERGMRTVQSIELDLQRLVPPPPAAPATLVPLDPELPAIFGVRPFPLRLTLRPEAGRFRRMRDGSLLGLTRDRRVLHYRPGEGGARQISDALPIGRGLGFHAWHATRACVVMERQGKSRVTLFSIDLETLHCHEITLPISSHPVRGSFVYEERLVLVLAHGLDIYSLTSGEERVHVQLARNQRWMGARSFRDDATGELACFSLSSKGPALRTLPRLPRTHGIASFLDLPHQEQPLVLDREGAPWFLGRPEWLGVRPLGAGARLISAAACGTRFLAQRGQRAFIVDLETATTTVVEHGELEAELCLEPDLRRYFSDQPSLPAHVRSVGLGSQGALHLLGPRCAWSIVPGKQRIAYSASLPSDPSISCALSFGPRRRVRGTGLRLSTIELRDGSRLQFDARGLLHVVHAKPEHPQLTLIVRAGRFAGWLSTGKCFGDEQGELDPEVRTALDELASLVRRNA